MEIRYCYARDARGKFVHIKDARAGEPYFCLECGNEMIPRLGEINAHHFAHKVECSCNGESYLHRVAKERFKVIYDRSASFILEYRLPVRCPYQKDTKSCVFADKKCNSSETTTRQLDLKTVFDECLIEAPVNDGQFYADILLRDSSGRTGKSLLIEFYHTHKCDLAKINSGYPIVEIKIDSDEDIIRTNRITYSDKITLYGFKDIAYKGKELYYASFEDETHAADLKVYTSVCTELFSVNYNSYYECPSEFVVAIDPMSYFEFRLSSKFKTAPSLGEVASAVAYSRGFREIENCAVCIHSRQSKFKEEDIWCTESKNDPELPKNPKNILAPMCPYSYPHTNRIKHIAKYISNLPYKVLRCISPIYNESEDVW